MTTIVIRKNNRQEYISFTCMGHAGYARRNKPDILCASISVLVINTINAMEQLAEEAMEVSDNEETGFINCVFQNVPKEKSVVLLDAMVLGLSRLSKTYGSKYLQVKFEEV